MQGKHNARADLVSTDWCQQIGAQTIEGVWDDSGLAVPLQQAWLGLAVDGHRPLLPLHVKLDVSQAFVAIVG